MDKKNTYSNTKIFLIIMGVLVVIAGIIYVFKTNTTVVAPVVPNVTATSTTPTATTTVSVPDTTPVATTTSPSFPTTGFDPE